jgi:hypothetical protein
MKHLRLALALTTVVVLGLAVSPAAPASASCTNVSGTVAFWATGPSSFAGSLTGDLAGTLTATGFAIVRVGDDGTIHYVVESQEFITDRGTLSAFVEGVLSPISPNYYWANERNVVVGGTGDFQGVTGKLVLHTDADLTVGQGSGRYHGRICG